MLLYALLHLTGYDLSLDDLSASASGAAGRPDIPSTTSRRASRPRPARSARASPTRSASPSPRRTWPRASTARATTSSTTTPRSLASDGDLMEGVAAEAARSPATSGSASSSSSTTTTTSRSRARRRCRSPRTSARGSPRYGWHVAARRRRQRPRRHRRGAPGRARRSRHARRSSSCAPSSATAPRQAEHVRGPRLAARARRGARRQGEPRLAARAGVLVPEPRASAHFRAAWRAGRAREADWQRALRRLARGHPRPRRRARAAHRRGRCPRAGTQDLPRFPADAQGLATRKASEAVLQALAARCRSSWAAPPILVDLHWLKTLATSSPAPARRAGRGRRPGGRRAQPALRRARARDGLDRERPRAARRASSRTARRSSSSPTTCGPRSGSPRSPSCRSSGSTRTTASASARTARRTSRSSTTRRCARFRTCSSSVPAMPTRPCVAWQVAIARRHGRPSSRSRARTCPTLDRSRFASAEGLRRGAYVLNPPGGAPTSS